MRTPESQAKLNHYAEELWRAREKYSDALETVKYYKHMMARYKEAYDQELKDPNFDLFAEMFETR